jgi:2',3'-cyclic-nucleotide 2'-phosphodiesterase (5'-nucleotidase family)
MPMRQCTIVSVAVLLLTALGAGILHASEHTAPGFAILAINDVYRIGGLDNGTRGGLARVRAARAALEERHMGAVLMLHAGDILFPSLLSRLYEGEQMIDVLNALDDRPLDFDPLMFAAFGNHEFEKPKLSDAAMLATRVSQAQFTWLGSNLRFASAPNGLPLIGGANVVDSKVVRVGGVSVGLFGLTTNIKVPDYILRFDEPIEVARSLSRLLRAQGAEVVIAVTHLPLSEDKRILRELGADGPDLIIGGHEHTRQIEEVSGRMVAKADADAVSASVVEVGFNKQGEPTFAHHYLDLQDATPLPDPMMAARVADWTARHARVFCKSQKESAPPNCLDDVLGHAAVELVAEEIEIRSYETNFGNWIADQALEAFRAEGAQVAFVNAGSLRLNQNIGAGRPVTRRDLEELLAFPTDLRLIEINGALLKAVAQNAAQGWPGNGRWLQIAGFAFRHHPGSETATDNVTLLTAEGELPIDNAQPIRAVTGTYLLDTTGDQDGYTMLNMHQVVSGSHNGRTLKQLVIEGLQASGGNGIQPRQEGRICSADRLNQPCLAVADR